MAMEAQLNSFSADPNRKIIPTEIETKDTTAGMVSSTNTVKKERQKTIKKTKK